MDKRQSGFTLIELLIVIFVIAIVAAAALYALNPARRIGESNDARRKSDLESISKAIEFYTADYGYAPSQLASSSIAVGSKYVLCSSAGTLTCDGQSKACIVVTDNNFLGQYLPTLPIDPSKSTTIDTGYYISRSNNNTLVLGSCTSYSSADVQISSRVNLPTYVAPLCPNGVIDGAEVCDYVANGSECEYSPNYVYNAFVADGVTCTAAHSACNGGGCNYCMNSAMCHGYCDAGGVFEDLGNGYCWYLGASGDSCDTTCASHNGCSDDTFNDIPGCDTMISVGQTCNTCSSVASDSAPYYEAGDACFYRGAHPLATSCSASTVGKQRLCACNK